MGTYVYGIIRSFHPPLRQDLEGIGDPPRPVRVMGRGELAAIVSDAPEELRPKRRDLLAHQRVLDEAAAEGVVLPMRFGSVSADDDIVAAVLAELAEHFLERLQALEGSAEYNIKANHDEEAVLRLIMADREDIRSLADANREAGGGTQEQKMQLGEMIAAAVQEREAADAELLHLCRRRVRIARSCQSGGVNSKRSLLEWLAVPPDRAVTSHLPGGICLSALAGEGAPLTAVPRKARQGPRASTKPAEPDAASPLPRAPAFKASNGVR
ncbi:MULTISPECIES: GvpL/GvpF family gas vesicle protein [unclassified Streptomyces]|uniref:GvpL/GvpF family gas vesicle protein n=1 Tax=unclassified Streptomyces TaxID=2593676 RepID=UPI0009395141|nr:GvpL/GvpF family gas vesicle protein [Streptomyces sp. CB01883]